jgi:hypothetical protein
VDRLQIDPHEPDDAINSTAWQHIAGIVAHHPDGRRAAGRAAPSEAAAPRPDRDRALDARSGAGCGARRRLTSRPPRRRRTNAEPARQRPALGLVGAAAAGIAIVAARRRLANGLTTRSRQDEHRAHRDRPWAHGL